MSNKWQHRHPGGHKSGRKWSGVKEWTKASASMRRWWKGIWIEESQDEWEKELRQVYKEQGFKFPGMDAFLSQRPGTPDALPAPDTEAVPSKDARSSKQ